MTEDTKKVAKPTGMVEYIAISIFTVWLGWISYEVVGIKSDKNIDNKINTAVMQLTQSVGAVNGRLGTEIERSKIKDNQQHNWLKFVSDLAQENKGRIITLEVQRESHNNAH